MPDRFIPPQQTLPRTPAFDLFPELSDDMDRRIMHSETRIKFWIIGGVLANVLVAVGGVIPIVYMLGQVSSQFATAVQGIDNNTTQLNEQGTWRQNQELWKADVEAYLRQQGYETRERR